jgi:RNA polymerase sigma factor (sigma-70 family)
MTAVTAYASYKPARQDAGQPGNNSVVIDLVACARGGDIQAWDTLVKRYTPLIASICRRYQFGRADADDVCQRVWLSLVNHLDNIRQPAALPGWIATTTRRECDRLVRAARGRHAATCALDTDNIPDTRAEAVEQRLLAAERHAALREALSHLPLKGQRLIAMLAADPPVPYIEISARLGIPVGSIGPTRRRYLDRIRRHPAVAALIDAESDAPEPVMAAAS